jgi:hypothetical protein
MLKLEDDWRELVRTPRSIVPTHSEPRQGTSAQIAQQVVSERTAQLRLSLPNLAIRNIRSGPVATTVSFTQHINNVPVHGGGLAIVLAEDGRLVRIGNRFIPFATNGSTVPSVTLEEATRVATRELGRSPQTHPTMTKLIVYPVDRTALLAWMIELEEWTVYVDAHTGSVIGVEHSGHFADGTGQVWLPNPHVARQDSTIPNIPTNCSFNDIYRIVPIRGVTDSAGVWQLRGDHVRLTYPAVNSPLHFQSAVFPPQFISPRCIGGVIDPNGLFQQTLGYYFVQNATQFLYDQAGLIRDSCPQGPDDPCALPVRLAINATSPLYSPGARQLQFATAHLEDAELVFHEYGHAINHDQSGPFFEINNYEHHMVKEGGIADFFATNLLAHEPFPYEDLIWEWLPQSGSRFLLANTRFPWDCAFTNTYRNGHVLSNAFWDVFRAFESQPWFGGPCAPLSATGPDAWLDPCEARNEFYRRFAYAMGEAVAIVGLTMRSMAESMMEADELLSAGQNLPVMMRAFNRHGWFFTEHDKKYGIDFEVISVPRDTTLHGQRFVALRLTTDTGVVPGSVYLHYGQFAQFPDSVAMTLNPAYGTGAYTGIIPDVNVSNRFVYYYISARNGKGVLAQWPKSAPFDDHAQFWVGSSFRSLHEHTTLLTVLPGTKDSLAFTISDLGTVHDLNVRVKVDAKRIGFSSWRIAHQSGPTYTTRDLIGILDTGPITVRHLSWPNRLDIWFDDERDAFYHHFEPYRMNAEPGVGVPHPKLSDFNNQPRAGQWRLIVDNTSMGSDTVFVRSWAIQLAESAPVSVEEQAVPRAVTRLSPPIPNPSHYGTRIPFSVGSDGFIQLKVYDVAGRLVRVLVNEQVIAGEYLAYWDGRNARGLPVGSGVYFIKLLGKEIALDEKAIVLR